jgi:hypothetical protein
MALARSAGPVNTAVRTDMVAGMMNAAPAPMTARIAMSWPAEVASAAPSDPAPKTASPAASERCWPKRSPRLPAGSRAAAKTRV